MEMLGKIRRMHLRDKLSLHEITKRTGLSRALKAWFAQFEDVEVCVDYSTDWEFFMMLIGDLGAIAMPKRIQGRNIWNEIAAVDLENY
jgi:hypothetical protein